VVLLPVAALLVVHLTVVVVIAMLALDHLTVVEGDKPISTTTKQMSLSLDMRR
jgi:Tfp pilus assembly protein PilX